MDTKSNQNTMCVRSPFANAPPHHLEQTSGRPESPVKMSASQIEWFKARRQFFSCFSLQAPCHPDKSSFFLMYKFKFRVPGLQKTVMTIRTGGQQYIPPLLPTRVTHHNDWSWLLLAQLMWSELWLIQYPTSWHVNLTSYHCFYLS